MAKAHNRPLFEFKQTEDKFAHTGLSMGHLSQAIDTLSEVRFDALYPVWQMQLSPAKKKKSQKPSDKEQLFVYQWGT